MLVARDIVVAYPNGIRALEGVSLDVPRGAVVGLLGPNGAGKSTLLRVLSTLQRPDRGTVVVAGVDALQDPDGARAHLGYLPQEFGFPPALTPRELVDHFARLKGLHHAAARRDAVAGMLARVNLTAECDRPVRGLSGGMRQRLGIAVALLGAPDVLIVDEPTVALDPVERHRVHDLLLALADERAVLLSTHLVPDVDALCHRAIVLHRGRVMRDGTPAALADALRGTVFRARVARTEAAALRAAYAVVREFLVGGEIELTVIGEAPRDPRFEAAAPTLDDVYAVATT
ncbi:MAG: ABC transporter ATP-binding protein [Gemmatimonadaceae bacterium]|nr:ABC transporter ATP-binding protein [Gemmatimonadaceae bacterium]